MSEPPIEPPGPPPGPPPEQPSGPPYGSPYGPPYPAGPPGPYEAPRTSPWLGILLGALIIGPVLGVAGPIAAVLGLAWLEVDNGFAYFAGAVLLPLALPVPLLFFRPSRPWGVGIMIGAALTAIVLAGTCALILDGLSNA